MLGGHYLFMEKFFQNSGIRLDLKLKQGVMFLNQEVALLNKKPHSLQRGLLIWLYGGDINNKWGTPLQV